MANELCGMRVESSEPLGQTLMQFPQFVQSIAEKTRCFVSSSFKIATVGQTSAQRPQISLLRSCYWQIDESYCVKLLYLNFGLFAFKISSTFSSFSPEIS